MVASLWGPAYRGLGGYFRKMGELAIAPNNYPFMIGAICSFALIAAVPVTGRTHNTAHSSTQHTHTTLTSTHAHASLHHSASLPAKPCLSLTSSVLRSVAVLSLCRCCPLLPSVSDKDLRESSPLPQLPASMHATDCPLIR